MQEVKLTAKQQSMLPLIGRFGEVGVLPSRLWETVVNQKSMVTEESAYPANEHGMHLILVRLAKIGLVDVAEGIRVRLSTLGKSVLTTVQVADSAEEPSTTPKHQDDVPMSWYSGTVSLFAVAHANLALIYHTGVAHPTIRRLAEGFQIFETDDPNGFPDGHGTVLISGSRVSLAYDNGTMEPKVVQDIRPEPDKFIVIILQAQSE